MTQAGPLTWRTGSGWLVLSGGEPPEPAKSSILDTVTLRWAYSNRPMAILPTAGGSLNQLEELALGYGDLSGSEGYVVPIFGLNDAHQSENYQLLAESGLIYLADGPDALALVRALRDSPALEAIDQAYAEGASILGLGAAAMVLGAWVAGSAEGAQPEPGLGWVQNVIIEPRFAGSASAMRLHALLGAQPGCLGLGIPEGSALALGPDSQVETVGEGQVTVVLNQVRGETGAA